MIGWEYCNNTYEYEGYYKILPSIYDCNKYSARIKNGAKVEDGFNYSSDNNTKWMSVEELTEWIEQNGIKIGNI